MDFIDRIDGIIQAIRAVGLRKGQENGLVDDLRELQAAARTWASAQRQERLQADQSVSAWQRHCDDLKQSNDTLRADTLALQALLDAAEQRVQVAKREHAADVAHLSKAAAQVAQDAQGKIGSWKQAYSTAIEGRVSEQLVALKQAEAAAHAAQVAELTAQWAAERQALQQQQADRDATIRTLEQRVRESEECVAQQAVALAAVAEEMDVVQALHEQEVARARQQVAQFESTIASLQRSLDSTQADHKQKMDVIRQSHSKALQRNTTHLEQLKQELAAAEAKHAAIMETVDSRVKQVILHKDARIAALEAQLKAVEARAAEAERCLQAIDAGLIPTRHDRR